MTSIAFSTDPLMVQGRSFYTAAEIVPEGMSTEQALQHAGLDYTVIKRPLFYEGGEATGFFGLVREDDPNRKPWGAVTERYQTLQNRAAYTVVEEMVKESGALWVAGGIVDGGRKAWGLLKLPEDMAIAGDEIGRYVLFYNSHDGTNAFNAAVTPVRFRCTNALTYTLGNAKRSVKIHHTGDMGKKIMQAHEILFVADQYNDRLKQVGEKLALEKVSERRLNSWLTKLYPKGTTDTQEANQEQRREIVRRMLMETPNLEGHRDNAWGFVNAVAEVADWGSQRQRDRMDRLCWNADGALKNRALQIALS